MWTRSGSVSSSHSTSPLFSPERSPRPKRGYVVGVLFSVCSVVVLVNLFNPVFMTGLEKMSEIRLATAGFGTLSEGRASNVSTSLRDEGLLKSNPSSRGGNGLPSASFTLSEEVSFSLTPQKDSLWIELVSWEPRALVFHNILTDEECDHLVESQGKQKNAQ